MSATATALLASIPSPDDGSIHLGDLQLRAYGLMIALGVLAAVWLGGRRLEQKGIGTSEDMTAIALWAVPAGIIGARLYHVITDWQRFDDDPIRMLYVWEGGLGIWGGVALGVAVGLWVGRRRGVPLLPGLDAVAPAIALAQAIGRWGNWFNQELFGRPTDLPWGLEIDPEHRPSRYPDQDTFHPTFLYESLWLLLLTGVLLWLDRRRLRPGRLFAVYVIGYTFARFFIEGLRVDRANEILGLRVNEWVSLLLFLGTGLWLLWDTFRHREEVEVSPAVEARPAEDAVPEDAVPEDAVPEDAVPEDAVTEAAVTEDAVTEDAATEDAGRPDD